MKTSQWNSTSHGQGSKHSRVAREISTRSGFTFLASRQLRKKTLTAVLDFWKYISTKNLENEKPKTIFSNDS